MANELMALIADEVARNEREFEGVRARAMNAVTLSGVLVTVLAGFVATAADKHPDFLSTAAHTTLTVALAAFVLATLLALIVNLPQRVERSEPDELEKKAETEWGKEGWDEVAAVYLGKYNTSLRRANAAAAWWLMWTILLEAVGVAMTAVTAIIVLTEM